MGDNLLLKFGGNVTVTYNYTVAIATFYSTKMASRLENVTYYERNLSAMILIANQTV